MPALSIALTKSFDDPSKIGTSSLSISIKALSIFFPNKAAIKCSIVDTLTPNSFETVVFKVALVTLNILGMI